MHFPIDARFIEAEARASDAEQLPSKKSVLRVKTKIGALLRPGNKGAWPEVRTRLNRLLVGWSAYFSYGGLASAYEAVDRHVYDRTRNFLCNRGSLKNCLLGRRCRNFRQAEPGAFRYFQAASVSRVSKKRSCATMVRRIASRVAASRFRLIAAAVR